MKFIILLILLFTLRETNAGSYGYASADNIQHSSITAFTNDFINDSISYSIGGKLDKNSLTVLNAFIEVPQVRLGRVRYVYGLFNVSIDYSPDFTPLTAPVSMYRPSMQRFMTSGDGIQLFDERMIGNTFINSSITMAKPVFDNQDKITHDFLLSNSLGKINPKRSSITSIDVFASNIEYGFAVNYSRNELAMGIKPNDFLGNPISNTDSMHVVMNNISFRKYFNNGIDLTAEYMFSTGHGNTWDAAQKFFDTSPHGNLIALRYLGYNEYTFGLDYYNTGLNNLGVQSLQLSNQDTFSRSKWISIRKDITDKIIVKYQFSKLDGTACASYKTRSEIQLNYKF